MGGIEGEGKVNNAAQGLHVGTEALVIFHVAGEAVVHPGDVVGKLLKQDAGGLAHDVGEEVEASAVRHADNDFRNALRTRPLNRFVDERNKGLSALQREAFFAGKFRVEISFHAFRRDQRPQQFSALVGFQFFAGPGGFDAALQPVFLVGIGNRHILKANRSGVGLAQQLHNVAELHVVGSHQIPGVEHQIHVGVRQTERLGVQVADLRLNTQVDRIGLGAHVPENAVGLNQTQHRRLFGHPGAIGRGSLGGIDPSRGQRAGPSGTARDFFFQFAGTNVAAVVGMSVLREEPPPLGA